jgi:hypothetical protein
MRLCRDVRHGAHSPTMVAENFGLQEGRDEALVDYCPPEQRSPQSGAHVPHRFVNRPAPLLSIRTREYGCGG